MMPLDEVVRALKARWLPVLVVAAIFLVAAVALTFALPRYEATSKLAVDLGGVDLIGGKALSNSADRFSSFVATQMDILKSERVALGAVRRLGLDKQRQWLDKWQEATGGQGNFESWLAQGLLRKLGVQPSSRDSNVLTLSYSSADPQFSAAVANAFVNAYIDTTVEMQVRPARYLSGFFAERAKALRVELEQARARLSAYEKEHGGHVGEPDVESARLAELTSQLVSLHDEAARAVNLRKQARAAPGDIREVRNDPEVAALTGELVRLQGDLAGLKSEFGDQHHAVIQARHSIRDVRQRLDAAMRRTAEGLGPPMKVIEARLAEVQAAVERQRALVLRRKAQRDAAAALLRDVDSAEKAYGAVLTRASQTALEGANTHQTTITVLKSASPPLWTPAMLVRNAAVATLLGLLLGMALAVRAEHRDRRLRSMEDVARRLEQPLLITLPDGQARRQRAARSEQTRQRLVSIQPRLPAPRLGGNP
jgi:chain length determinant protein EpsF